MYMNDDHKYEVVMNKLINLYLLDVTNGTSRNSAWVSLNLLKVPRDASKLDKDLCGRQKSTQLRVA